MRALLLAIVFLLFFFLQLSSGDIPVTEKVYGQQKAMELPVASADSSPIPPGNHADTAYTTLYPSALLHQAIIQGDQERVVTILSENPESINKPSLTTGDTPLHVAISHRQNDIATLLLQKGALPDQENRFGETAIHFAKSASSIDLLAKSGASLNITDRLGATPLHRFCQNNFIEAVRTLLAYPVNLETQDNLGYTALHFAVQRNLTDMTILLLSEGASPHIKTLAGQTAFHLAREQGTDQIISALLAYGAYPDSGQPIMEPGKKYQDSNLPEKQSQ